MVTFNEVMYHPAPGDAGDAGGEWIELHNQFAVDVDLSGWRLAGGVGYTFAEGTTLAGGGYLVVAAQPSALEQSAGISGVLGGWSGSLSNGGEAVRLIDPSGRVMDELDYGDAGDWPVAADGGGASLAKTNGHLATGDPASWSFSQHIGGTPGSGNTVAASTLRLSEVAGALDADFRVEIENTGGGTLNLAGYTLLLAGSSETTFGLSGTIGAGGFSTFSQAATGIDPEDEDRLFLLGPGGMVLDATRVENSARARSVAWDGRWQRPDADTFGGANSFDFEDAIVINEVMYHHAPANVVPPSVQVQSLVTFTQGWRFNQTGVDQGAGWASSSHSAGAGGWQSGPGVLGFESATLAQPINTTLSLGPRTFYFETDFTVTGDPSAITSLELTHLVDDGAVFYLNGVEVGSRFNLPNGAINASTLASPGVINAALRSLQLDASALVAGVNRLSVEVHQSSAGSSDIVMGAELSAVTVTDPGVAYGEDPEEWIELYNRSGVSIDLSGWSLDDAVGFTFAPGTVLGAGDYLVVAKDAAALAASFPGITIAGAFTGKLSNAGERIQLLDAEGNLADEVRYFDGGEWADAADGGGSSLELRDPDADNANAGAWSASDEATRQGWQTVTYRGIASSPIPGAPTLWQEFAFGLLDGPGEFLIDDLSVVERPDTTAIQRIQNGGFNGGSLASWRLLGNHHNAQVVLDNGNPVLHVHAAGPAEYQGNQVETTFASGASIQDGVEYEVSYRVKWLSGGRRLNTRLYFDRVAHTEVLQAAQVAGTPGTVNSTHTTNAGPTYSGLRHGPVTPAANQATQVTVRAADPDGVASMTLRYRVDDGAWQSAAMSLNAEGAFAASVPGQSAGTVVQFYIQGVDTLGAVSTFPGGGADARALYVVDDGQGSSGPLDDFRVIMTPSDTQQLHLSTNVLSNERLGATVVFGGEVYYNVGVRLKGSFVGRDAARVGFSIGFNADQLFRGVHSSVAVDRSTHAVIGVDEILIKHIATHAGGIPGMYDDLIHFIAPRPQDTSTGLLRLSGFGDVYLDSQYDNGSDGSVFEHEVIRWATTTIDGNPQSQKRAGGLDDPNGYANVDIQDLGDDREDYRWLHLLTNNRGADDYDALIAFAQVMSLTGLELEQAAPAVMDVDQWMRTLAYQSLVGPGDAYFTGGAHHNFRLYERPSDGRILYMPWDWDSAFLRSTTAPLVGGGAIANLVNRPVNLRTFHGHLLDIINTTYNTAYMSQWTSHYGQLAGQNFASRLSYIGQRSSFVLGQLPSSIPFTIQTNGGHGFTTAASTVTLVGQGWIDVREVRLAGSETPLALTWTDESHWELTLPLALGANAIVLEAYDHQGTLVAADNITITSTNDAALARDFLRVSELHYHPAPPTAAESAAMPGVEDDDFEFIELINTSTTDTIDLKGVHFVEQSIDGDSQGIAFTFGEFSLAPGERVVVVRDTAAFGLRYGGGVNIAGSYAGKLSNGGELITLRDATGLTIQQFTYDDAGEWPASPDGDGPSLVVVSTLGDYATPGNWAASTTLHGTPGRDESDGVAGDINRDGFVGVADLQQLLVYWGDDAVSSPGALAADLNGDGTVGSPDLNIVIANFGSGTQPTHPTSNDQSDTGPTTDDSGAGETPDGNSPPADPAVEIEPPIVTSPTADRPTLLSLPDAPARPARGRKPPIPMHPMSPAPMAQETTPPVTPQSPSIPLTPGKADDRHSATLSLLVAERTRFDALGLARPVTQPFGTSRVAGETSTMSSSSTRRDTGMRFLAHPVREPRP